VLDANAVFGTVTETARFLAMLKEIPEIILVGIGYPDGITLNICGQTHLTR